MEFFNSALLTHLMPRGTLIAFRIFVFLHLLFWIASIWFGTRGSSELQLAAMGLWLLCVISWASIVIVLFCEIDFWLRTRLAGIVVVTPFAFLLCLLVGHILRPICFQFDRVAYEKKVQNIRAHPNQKVEHVQILRKNSRTGQPEEIRFFIGGGFPNYSQFYIWRATPLPTGKRDQLDLFLYGPHWSEYADGS